MSIRALFRVAPEHPDYTFETFVVSAASRDAFNSAVARSHNPIILTGASGSGKSHLLHAIAHAAPPRTALRVSGQDLIARLHAAIRLDQMHELRCLLATVDLLLVDEIPAHGRHTRRAVIELLGALVARGVQVVVATLPSRHLRLFPNVFAIGEPDAAARVEIAKREARRRGVALSEETLAAIGSTGSANDVRCAVTRLAAQRFATPPPDPSPPKPA